MTRTETREVLMKLLFQAETQRDFSDEFAEKYMRENKPGKSSSEYIHGLYPSIRGNLAVIDGAIEEVSKGWKIGRLPKVDLAILRLAVGELFYEDGLAPQITINEAVNMAKKYSTEESGRFINGVLGAIAGKSANA